MTSIENHHYWCFKAVILHLTSKQNKHHKIQVFAYILMTLPVSSRERKLVPVIDKGLCDKFWDLPVEDGILLVYSSLELREEILKTLCSFVLCYIHL